jgi:ligand-binding SRPBCC domain-containing protein
MMERVWELEVAASQEEVWAFHSSAEALEALTPPGRKLTPLTDDLEVRNGALHVMGFKLFGIIPQKWKARISDVRPPHGFVDTAEPSPFKAWRHQHEFIALPNGGTLIRDTVTYIPPGGPFAGLVNKLFVSKDLDALWAFRHQATKKALDSKLVKP